MIQNLGFLFGAVVTVLVAWKCVEWKPQDNSGKPYDEWE